MKTKLLLNPGTGYCGTTPFYYTLRDAKFCHAGYKKEFHYLHMMYSNNEEFREFMVERYTQPEKDFRTGELPEITAEYDKDHYQALLEPEHSFDKYIYHMQYMKDMFPEYHAVCDFSNYNISLPEEFMTEHAKALEPYFDVKVTMLIADPVFRYYQEVGGLISMYHSSERKRKKLKKFVRNEDLMYNHYIRTKQQQKLFRWCIERSRFSKNCNYEYNFNKLCWSYGNKNVLLIQMEKFWDSSYHNEMLDKLSTFLDYEIKPEHLHPNVYCSKEKEIEGLADQNTEFEPLTDELYELGKKHL